MSKDPWFPFYHSDWIGGTRRLSPTARAIYIDVLCMIYSAGGPIDRDDIGMARECAVTLGTFKKSMAELLLQRKFEEVDGRIFNEKAAKSIQKAEEKSKSSSNAANKRWDEFNKGKQQPTDADALPTHDERICESDATTATTTVIEVRKKEPKKVLSKESRGTRIDENFEPDASCHVLAEQLLLSPSDGQGALANFIDYWKGIAGAKGVKLDWQATFRNQLRHIAKNRNYNAKSKPDHPATVAANKLREELGLV